MKPNNYRSKLYRLTLLLTISLLLVSCSQNKVKEMKVNDATIKIKPYNKRDHGKIWSICIDYENVSLLDNPTAYFVINSVDKKKREFSVRFVHLVPKCKDMNVLVYFTHKHTPREDWEWLKELDADDIEYVILKVKRSIDDNYYIFQKEIQSRDLKW